MSFDKSNKQIYKNKISEDEEGEEEDDSEKESQNKNHNKIQNKINFSESENNNDSSVNEEENENEEKESSSSIHSNKSKNKKISKEEYIAQIEELKNELELERDINCKLGDKDYYEEVKNLKKELSIKSNNLDILILSNKKQNLALNKLKKQIEEITNKNEKDEEKIKEGGSILKIKDKKVLNAINKMKILKNENEKMKKILYESEDYNKKINLEDKRKNNKGKIDELTNEKNILIKELEQHKLCIKEQNKYKEEYNKLKLELKELKSKIKDAQIKIEKLINEHNKNNNIKITNYFVKRNININNNLKININLAKNKLSSSSSTPNFRLFKNKVLILNENRKNKNIELPIINSNSMILKNKPIINNSFNKKIKEFLNGDEDQYMTLMNKINNLENNKKIKENKHANELKKYDSKILNLDEKYHYLNINSKESNINIRFLKYKLSIIKNGNKKILKKLNELKKEFKAKDCITKKKNNEISSLLEEINSIKNTVKNEDVKSTKSEIIQYITQLKKEKEIKHNYNNNEIENEEIEKNNLNDENIQVDFSENEDDND